MPDGFGDGGYVAPPNWDGDVTDRLWRVETVLAQEMRERGATLYEIRRAFAWTLRETRSPIQEQLRR